jgi:hypothetical protein
VVTHSRKRQGAIDPEPWKGSPDSAANSPKNSEVEFNLLPVIV